MSDKNAPYLVYTNDKDFVLNKEDINSGGGSGGGGDIVIIEGIPSNANIKMQASYNDLNEHFNNGKVCFLHLTDERTNSLMLISGIAASSIFTANVIWCVTLGDSNIVQFEANSATENLVFTMGN